MVDQVNGLIDNKDWNSNELIIDIPKGCERFQDEKSGSAVKISISEISVIFKIRPRLLCSKVCKERRPFS